MEVAAASVSVEVGVKPLGGVLASEVVSVCCAAQAGTTGGERLHS